MADDDNDMIVTDEAPARPARPAPPIDQRSKVIPEEEREIPAIVETIAHNDRGEPIVLENVPRFFYARTLHNLPAWNLWQNPKDGPQEGWVPNDEEGVHAVELGWIKIIDAPDGAVPPA